MLWEQIPNLEALAKLFLTHSGSFLWQQWVLLRKFQVLLTDQSMCPVPLARPLLAPAPATHKLPQDLCTGCLPCRKCPVENSRDKSLTQFLASRSVLSGSLSRLFYLQPHSSESFAFPGFPRLSPANSVHF